MRYILKDTGYIEAISFTHEVECNNKTCIEYTGSVPEGYENLAEWSDNANINAYKIVDGNLTYDSEEDTRLQELWEEQQADSGGTSTLNGNVVDSLEGNSTTDAPSQRAVNDAIKNSWRNRQNRFDCILTAKKPTASQWSAIAENYTTPIIPAGRYLIAFRTTMLGAGGGVSTINPCLDGTRLHATLRTTIPIVSGLRSSAQSDVYRDFTEETTHTVNIEAYSNVGVTPENVEVWFIRLD